MMGYDGPSHILSTHMDNDLRKILERHIEKDVAPGARNRRRKRLAVIVVGLLCTTGLAVLVFHPAAENSFTRSGFVQSLAFSPDGRLLASGSRDCTVKLWHVGTGRSIRTLSGHSRWVYSVAFSPDGSMLASGSADKTVRLWDVESGEEIRTLSGHSGCVRSVAFSPDGRILASADLAVIVKHWDLENGKEIRTLSEHVLDVWSVAFSPAGDMLVSACGDGTIRLWGCQE